jgi:hypothetical protein
MAFDPPFSPRHLSLGTPLLTLYYLGALSVGYFSGYFLLIFGNAPSSRLQFPSRNRFNFWIPWWSLAFGCSQWRQPGWLIETRRKSATANDDTFQKYASFVEENLPRSGGILLSDDPVRLFLVEAALARDGRAKDFLPLDTQSLNWPAITGSCTINSRKSGRNWYRRRKTKPLNPIGLISALTMLSKTNELYYLHPSFGYYFEQFYQEPHGLVYKLKILPEDTLLPPLPDKNQIAENEAFWARVETQAFAPIKRAVTPPDPNAPRSWGERLLNKFHVPREQNQNAILAGTFYSRSLNFWGVQLQRAGESGKRRRVFRPGERSSIPTTSSRKSISSSIKAPRRQKRAGGLVQNHQ